MGTYERKRERMNLTPDELAYLVHLLGGRSTYDPKRLGEGLSAVGALQLRAKLERMAFPITIEQAQQDVQSGKVERVCRPGEWVVTRDGVTYFDKTGQQCHNA